MSDLTLSSCIHCGTGLIRSWKTRRTVPAVCRNCRETAPSVTGGNLNLGNWIQGNLTNASGALWSNSRLNVEPAGIWESFFEPQSSSSSRWKVTTSSSTGASGQGSNEIGCSWQSFNICGLERNSVKNLPPIGTPCSVKENDFPKKSSVGGFTIPQIFRTNNDGMLPFYQTLNESTFVPSTDRGMSLSDLMDNNIIEDADKFRAALLNDPSPQTIASLKNLIQLQQKLTRNLPPTMQQRQNDLLNNRMTTLHMFAFFNLEKLLID